MKLTPEHLGIFTGDMFQPLMGHIRALDEELASAREREKWSKEIEPCGHSIQCQIGDEHGHFTCQWCAELKAGEAAAYRKAADAAFSVVSSDFSADSFTKNKVYEALIALISPSAQSALGSMIAKAVREEYEKRQVCTICDTHTELACSDCQIDLATTVYVCQSSECRDRHEEKCPHQMKKRLDDIFSINDRNTTILLLERMLRENIWHKDSGGNSTLSRLQVEIDFNKNKNEEIPVTDSSLTHGDLRKLLKLASHRALGEPERKKP